MNCLRCVSLPALQPSIMAVFFLIYSCIAAAAAAAAAQACTLGGNASFPDSTYNLFTVNIECLPSGLNVTWKAWEGESFLTEFHYICTDGHGNNKTKTSEVIDTYGFAHGSDDTISVHLAEDVKRYGGKCTVYGCHEQYHGRYGGTGLVAHNKSCEYTPPGTEVLPSSRADAISPTSTSTHRGLTTLTTTYTSSTSQYPSHFVSNNPSSTYPSHISTSWRESFGTSPSEAGVSATSISLNLMQEVQPTTTPLKRGFSTTVIIIVIPVAVTLAIFTFTTLIVIIGIFYCNKSKPRMNSRFKNLGIALNFDAEKIDPSYTPIQVGSYIRKCESMGSILDYLTPDKKGGKQKTILTIPVGNALPQQSKVVPSQAFVLQPPPLKPQSECFNLSRLKSEESSESDSMSDYKSSSTSIATGSHMDQTELESDGSLLSASLVNTTMACSNIFERKLCRTGSSFSDDSYSSQSMTDSSIVEQGLDSKMVTYNHDKLVLSNPDEDSDAVDVQDNRVVLVFSSSHNYTDNIIIIEPESDPSGTLSVWEEETLAETNLTINPRHFDPL